MKPVVTSKKKFHYSFDTGQLFEIGTSSAPSVRATDPDSPALLRWRAIWRDRPPGMHKYSSRSWLDWADSHWRKEEEENNSTTTAEGVCRREDNLAN